VLGELAARFRGDGLGEFAPGERPGRCGCIHAAEVYADRDACSV